MNLNFKFLVYNTEISCLGFGGKTGEADWELNPKTKPRIECSQKNREIIVVYETAVESKFNTGRVFNCQSIVPLCLLCPLIVNTTKTGMSIRPCVK